MNNRHRKIMAAIFADPVSGTIAWADIETIFLALGCEIVEGAGSRVRFRSGSEIESFHRPHPAKEAKRYQVRSARAFLLRIGAQP
jgi:hypothetical protein